MHPRAPFPPPPPGASPAVTAAALARALAARGLTGIYTATAARFGLVSVTAAVTAWTNGHQIWCTCAGQHHAWPAADIEAAAAALAALARPGGGSVNQPAPAAPAGRPDASRECSYDDALTRAAPPLPNPRPGTENCRISCIGEYTGAAGDPGASGEG